MITPFFTIDQDDEFVFINIQVSHVRFNAKAVEMTCEKEVFIFSLSPYYLRLRLPFNCVDDERSNAVFEGDIVKVRVAKEVRGQVFPDLDLTAKLLARVGEMAGNKDEKKPMIEEMDLGGIQEVKGAEDPEVQGEDIKDQSTLDGSDFGWEIKQQVPEVSLLPTNSYGFNNAYTGIIGVSVSNGNDINELSDPENTPEAQRIMERLIKENIKFDPEYYAADYISSKTPEDDYKDFKGLLEWKNPTTVQFLKWYKKEQSKPKDQQSSCMPVEFTEDEQKKMLDLPKKTYLLTPEYKSEMYLLIVSLLFAYHFDVRETEGDHTVESAWTVGRLVPQFACLDSKIAIQNDINTDNGLKAMVITCYRRSMCYPLHRNFDLAAKVWTDVYYNIRGGKRLVLKSLLDLKELFRFHDVYYVYDQIWMKDLCRWVLEDVSEYDLRVVAHDLKRETDKVDSSVITFEKPDGEFQEPDSDDEEEEEEDEDDMVIMTLKEIESWTI